MLKALCMKIFWIIMGIFGVITVVLCVWMLTINIKVTRGRENITQLPSGHSPKIGLAAGALMIGTGIAGCIVNIANRRVMMGINIMAALALSCACFAFALKDHIETEDRIHLMPMHLYNAYRQLQNRWKIIAAVSGIDTVIEVVGFIIVLTAHREQSSGNVMQMNKRY